MQDDAEQRAIDLEPIGVVDESQALKFPHEEIDSRPRRADYFGQCPLRHRRDGRDRRVHLAVPCKQQERPGQSFLAVVEQLVGQVRLDPDVPRQQMRDEPIGQRVLAVQHAHHLILLHEKDGAARDRGRTPRVDGYARQASFPKEVAGAEHCHDGLSAPLGDDREPHTTSVDIEDAVASVALAEDDVGSPKLHDPSRDPRRAEEGLDVERALWLGFHCHSPPNP